MDEPITVRYTWTLDEHQTAIKYAMRRMFRRPLPIVLCTLIVLNFIVLLLIADGTRRCGYVLFFLTVLLAAGVGYVMLKWMTRRMFSKRPDANTPIEWTISPEELRIVTAHAQSTLQWTALTEMVITSHGVLLYPLPRIFYWLPKHGFESEAAYAAFIELAKTNLKTYSTLR